MKGKGDQNVKRECEEGQKWVRVFTLFRISIGNLEQFDELYGFILT